MFTKSSLITTMLLALSVAGSPLHIRDDITSLNFSLSLNLNGMKLSDLDRARVTNLLTRGKAIEQSNTQDEKVTLPADLNRRASSFSATDTGVSYLASVDIGSPATSYNLLIDTGSSNTWVGASKAYSKTSSSKSTSKQFSVTYGSGQASGDEYTDTVALSSSLVIDQQSIGVATSANVSGLKNADGILGLGPVGLTKGTVNGTSKVPTVADNLYSQKKINSEVIGISYSPLSSSSQANGELSFGGDDSSKYSDSVTYAPITKSSPAKHYWGYDQSVTYGSSDANVLSSTAGILDTGTTLILFATDAFNRYKSLTGATYDGTTGLLMLTSSQYQNLQSLYFTIGKTKFELTANAQIWPRSMNSDIGGSSGNVYLIISDLGSNSGQGLDFINGYKFLERFYSVYDTANSRVGLANTQNTKATTN